MMNFPKFSLSFSKKVDKKILNPSAIGNDVPKDLTLHRIAENIDHIDEHFSATSSTQGKESDLVIPLVEDDRSEFLRKRAKLQSLEELQKEDLTDVADQVAEHDWPTAETNTALSIEERAEAALIAESRQQQESWSKRAKINNTLAITAVPSLLHEEGKTGLEVFGGLGVTGKESSIDEYDQIVVENFGAALLRGMGWKKDLGVGKNNRRVVEILEPTSSSFGLVGSKKKKADEGAAEDEELYLKKGCHVMLHGGRHKGTYGTVESLDTDHLLIRSAVGHDIIREVEPNVTVITKTEFKDSSRVINKEMYDQYKEKEGNKNRENASRSSAEKVGSINSEGKNKIKCEGREDAGRRQNVKWEGRFGEEMFIQEKRVIKCEVKREDNVGETYGRNRYDSSSGEKESINGESGDVYDEIRDKRYKDRKKERQNRDRREDNIREQRDDHRNRQRKEHERKQSELDTGKYLKSGKGSHDDSSKIYHDTVNPMNLLDHTDPAAPIPWVRESLRVRLISKKYKDGRHHKEKVTVTCVDTAESCECRTDNGILLRDVDPRWLETVIPKCARAIVMVLKGEHKGQMARILQLNAHRQKASVQLAEDAATILNVSYDDICEYVAR